MLIGRGALANYHDIPAGLSADFDHWHTIEHLPERLGLPGFLRGRRCRALDAAMSPQYFILYETADVSVLRSEPYLARLDDPTLWTARVSAGMTRTLRTAARVCVSSGRGVGGFMLTVRIDCDPGSATAADAPLGDSALTKFSAQPGVCGAHLLQANATVTSIDTNERRMRDPRDELVPWMVLLEGSSRESLEDVWRQLRATLPATLRAHARADVYALQVVFALCDL
jgi:hypothetical protein